MSVSVSSLIANGHHEVAGGGTDAHFMSVLCPSALDRSALPMPVRPFHTQAGSPIVGLGGSGDGAMLCGHSEGARGAAEPRFPSLLRAQSVDDGAVISDEHDHSMPVRPFHTQAGSPIVGTAVARNPMRSEHVRSRVTSSSTSE